MYVYSRVAPRRDALATNGQCKALEVRTVPRTDKKLHPLIFSHGTWHAINLLPSETEDAMEFTYMDSTSTLAVGQDASFLKNRRTSALLGHPERSLAGIPYTKQSYSQPWGTLGSELRPSPLARRNSTGCTY